MVVRKRVTQTIQKSVKKISMRNQKSDFAYWQTRSYQERLDALERIRQEYHGWKYGVQPRLQRVYRVVKRK